MHNTWLLSIILLLTYDLTAGQDFDTSPVTISESGGATVILPCIINNLQRWDRVIWQGPIDDYLFADEQKYSIDDRISLPRDYKNDYSLRIENVRSLDEGVYKCNSGTMVKKITLRVVVSPKIVKPSSNKTMTVYEGDKILLSCSVVGTPTPNVTWYRETTNEHGTVVKEEFSRSGSQLVIYNIEREAAGTYICEASNGIPPKAQRFIDISVYYKPFAIVGTSEVSQFLGQDAVLKCFIDSSPEPTMRWLKDGMEVNETDKYVLAVEQTKEDYTFSLRIMHVEESDFGVYTCIAENVRGDSTASVDLKPLGVVKIESITKDLKAIEGEAIELTCNVSADPRPIVIWNKYSAEGNLVEVTKGGVLKLDSVKRSDGGMYACIGDNGMGFPAARNVSLNVEYPPEVTIRHREFKVYTGKEAIVECVIMANPEPKRMLWSSKEGENKTFEHTMEVMRSSGHSIILTMKILEVDSDVLGEYECFAENIHGSDREVIELIEGTVTTPKPKRMTTPKPQKMTTPKPQKMTTQKPKKMTTQKPATLGEKTKTTVSKPLGNISSMKPNDQEIVIKTTVTPKTETGNEKLPATIKDPETQKSEATSNNAQVKPGSVAGTEDNGNGASVPSFSRIYYMLLFLVFTFYLSWS